MKSIKHYVDAVQNRTMSYINQRRGWTTDRKIIVIESDDWGSIRMPSREIYEKLLSYGIRVDKCGFCKNDSLATEEDLNLLFNLLLSHKDSNNNPLVITANTLVANPDFEKIKESEFQEYYYKVITDSFKENKDTENSLEIWKKGINENLFYVQSHGREHVNVNRWMNYLRGDYPETKFAFDHNVYGISTIITSENRKSFLPAFDFESIEEENKVNKIAQEGLQIFKEIFGFESKSFIASNYTWSKSLEKTLFENGVKYLQGTHTTKIPIINKNTYKTNNRYLGKTNEFNQIDLVRNVNFEPYSNPNKDWVDSTINKIDKAFKLKKPAIISSHRVNFIGRINKENRDNTLNIMDSLFKDVEKRWPDIEYMNSVQLGDVITDSKQ
jgi:hypothetical protein